MTETKSYTSTAIILHWVLALLLISMIFFGHYMEGLREDLLENGIGSITEVQFAFNAHKTTGLIILALSLFRLLWRFTHKVPALPEGMNALERNAANATHFSFYALMIGMPLGGMIAASASRFPTWLFNNPDLTLPKLPVPQTDAFYDTMASAHSFGSWALVALIVLHVLAALKHQYIDKDGLLTRMLPFMKG